MAKKEDDDDELISRKPKPKPAIKKPSKPPKSKKAQIRERCSTAAGSAGFFEELSSNYIEIKNAIGSDPKFETLGSTISVGVAFPSFCLEWMFSRRTLPLGKSCVTQLVGLPGSSKSSLFFEMCNWFYDAGGGAVLVETEDKQSDTLGPSIVGWRRTVVNISTNSVEDWQKQLMNFFEFIKRRSIGTQSSPGPGRTVPVIGGVDSLVGKMSEENMEKTHDAGHGMRGHPVEAMQIGRWLKVFTREARFWPFHLVLVNHILKNKVDGVPVRQKGGGGYINFQQATEIELTKKGLIDQKNRKGVHLEMALFKNSNGVGGRMIEVDMCWKHTVDTWEDPKNKGKMLTGKRQHTWFDWHGATGKLLLKLCAEDRQIHKLLRLERKRLSDGTYGVFSPAFKISENAPLSFQKFGDLLMNDDTGKLEELRLLTSVEPGVVFRPGVDFGDQVKESVSVAAEQIRKSNDLFLKFAEGAIDAAEEEDLPPRVVVGNYDDDEEEPA